MSTLADFRTWQDERIRDGAAYLTQGERDNAIDQARRTYSRHVPRSLVYDLTGDGGYDYAPPPGWVSGFSDLLSVEADPANNQDPADGMLEGNEFQTYDSPTGERVRFTDRTPATTDTLRLSYTVLHTLDVASSTIPALDELAVADLAAAVSLRQLGARFAQVTDSTMDADAVDYGERVAMYAALADRYLRQYRDHIGVGTGDEAGEAAAVEFLDIDSSLSAGSAGWSRLFHSGPAY